MLKYFPAFIPLFVGLVQVGLGVFLFFTAAGAVKKIKAEASRRQELDKEDLVLSVTGASFSSGTVLSWSVVPTSKPAPAEKLPEERRTIAIHRMDGVPLLTVTSTRRGGEWTRQASVHFRGGDFIYDGEFAQTYFELATMVEMQTAAAASSGQLTIIPAN